MLKLPISLRRIVGTLTLCGAALGVLLGVDLLLRSELSASNTLLAYTFLALYGGGILTGLLLIEGNQKIGKYAFAYWAMQIPIVELQWLTYRFASGASFELLLGSDGLRFSWYLGSKFLVGIGEVARSSIGINVLALSVALVLLLNMLKNNQDKDSALSRPS